jgi:hypothetical protein
VKIPFASKVSVGVAFALFIAAGPAAAIGSLLDINITNRDSGQQLQIYQHRGKMYVVGTPGEHYAISLRNTQGERLMGVISVDGVNVVSGETASPSQTGYVFSAYASSDITGWRKSQQQVAAFIFSEEGASYAARTGRPDNVGVIGVAVFREQQRIRQYAPEASSRRKQASPSRADAAAEASGVAPAPHLGTAHGERENSSVDYTDFNRARSTPDETIAIHYDSFQNLQAMGVIPRHRRDRERSPDPFPNRFVPDPPR